nr:MAG TPA: hypothetical protein [Caudoviricetes sp.]
MRLESAGARAAVGAAADRERRRAAAQGHQPARGLRPATGRGPYFFGLWPRPLRHETAAGGSPRLCTRPANPQARGPGIKSACGTCARKGPSTLPHAGCWDRPAASCYLLHKAA